MPIDLEFLHPTDIYALRPCRNPDATDLVAVGGEHSVEVILVSDTACRRIACFHVGSRITTLAWSSKTTSPSATDKWTLELVAATSDFGLHLLTKSPTSSEYIFPFGGGLSGHHGRVNDMVFCGGWDEDSSRYVATVSDDKMLMVWDLHPTVDPAQQGSRTPSPALELGISMSPPMSARPQPTAYVIPFPHPLAAIRSHPATSKEFLVADARGSVFLADWRSDPDDEASATELRHSSVIELVEPVKLAAAAMGGSRDAQGKWSACVDWRVDSMDVVGGVFGQKFAIWDISKLRGGLPHTTGPSFSDGGRIFRWCPTHPDYFAISSQSPSKGAIVHVHNYSYVHAPPTVFTLRPKPHFVRDFDFLAAGNIPRLVIAVGRFLIVFPIGEEP